MEFMAVIGDYVCVEVSKGTPCARKCGGSYWLPERIWEMRKHREERKQREQLAKAQR